ncbi:MAG: HD domain-containing phosphohydrolase [Pseudomonadota bacterium]
MDKQAKGNVLIVDSSADNLLLMKEILHGKYQVSLARTGADGLRLARQAPHPDVLLLDTSLPDMDGFSLFQELKCTFFTAEIPVIFLVADQAEERRALREGGADSVGKPLCPETLAARVATQLRLVQANALLKDQHSHLEQLVVERTRAVAQLQDATIMAMASLAESRDPDTGWHIRRTQHYVAALARELRFNPSFTAELTDENIALLFKAAPLHDIGKVGVPDAILLKPGRLSDEEMDVMKLHTVYGRDAIVGVEQALGEGNQFLRYASEITYSHQEKWDGSGYPQGLAGTQIPLSARLMALADVYDALISERTYRPAFTHETAVELIRQGRGEHFDPDVVDAMLVIQDKFLAIAAQFQAP